MKTKLDSKIIFSYATVFAIAYVVVPYTVGQFFYPIEAIELTKISLIGISGLTIGYILTNIRITRLRLRVPVYYTLILAFLIFSAFVILTLVTAPHIPVIEALKGADPDLLAIYREEFLKNRTGWEIVLKYANTFLGGAIIPYLIVLGIEKKYWITWLFAIVYFLFSISFLAKANFLKIALPICFYFWYRSQNKVKFSIVSMSGLVLLLLAMYTLTGNRNKDSTPIEQIVFSNSYIPNTMFSAITYRVAIIPVVTALDAIQTFKNVYGSKFFMGDTSSLIAGIKGKEQVKFEKEVFKYQWGGSGNANSMYFMEGFVNFGFLGVLLFGILSGLFIGGFLRSNQVAGKSIGVLFMFYLFNAGLIGTMISNGFLFCLILVALIIWK